MVFGKTKQSALTCAPSPYTTHLDHLDSIINNMFEPKAFENTSTNVAASQMRNALNNLADTVRDADEKKVRNGAPCFRWI
jgi:hypothetical protein